MIKASRSCEASESMSTTAELELLVLNLQRENQVLLYKSESQQAVINDLFTQVASKIYDCSVLSTKVASLTERLNEAQE